MIKNFSPYAVDILPFFSTTGAAQRIVVVKVTFDLEGHVVPPQRRLPVNSGDVFDKIAGRDSMRFESDAVPLKKNVDVIVNATAFAPRKQALREFDAAIQVASVVRTIKVWGPRRWRRYLALIPTISDPESVLSIPVSYTLAFGGIDGNDEHQFCAHNPTGLGYCRGLPIDGLPLPQIEWPDQLITRPSDKPTPAGFGCYARTWQPRVRFLGKFDANKLNQGGIQTKMPKSFSAQAWNCAHPLMQFKSENIVAGTSIQLLNLSQAGELSLRIPRVKPTISIVSAEHERSAFTPAFDTITIEPNLGHFAMTWRHTFDVGPAHPKIQTVEVHA